MSYNVRYDMYDFIDYNAPLKLYILFVLIRIKYCYPKMKIIETLSDSDTGHVYACRNMNSRLMCNNIKRTQFVFNINAFN